MRNVTNLRTVWIVKEATTPAQPGQHLPWQTRKRYCGTTGNSCYRIALIFTRANSRWIYTATTKRGCQINASVRSNGLVQPRRQAKRSCRTRVCIEAVRRAFTSSHKCLLCDSKVRKMAAGFQRIALKVSPGQQFFQKPLPRSPLSPETLTL